MFSCNHLEFFKKKGKSLLAAWKGYQQSLKGFKKQDVEKIIVDEIYTFYKHKNLKESPKSKKKNFSYIFTAMICLKNGKRLPFFRHFENRNELNLIKFLKDLPQSECFYSDCALIYETCNFEKFICQKSIQTNIVESFNFVLRNKNACLRRRSVTYAKNLHNFSLRLIYSMLDIIKNKC